MCDRWEHEVEQVSQDEAALIHIDDFFWALEGYATTVLDARLREIERLSAVLDTTDTEVLLHHSMMLKARNRLDETADKLYRKEQEIRQRMDVESVHRDIAAALSPRESRPIL
jgi:hypothetical protein